MTTTKKPKKQKLRNAEYYDLQGTFDKLYSESKNGRVFHDLMPTILSENNICLAYRNLKKNSGSMTAGTDKKTIKHLETWKEQDIYCRLRQKTPEMVCCPACPTGGNTKGKRKNTPFGDSYHHGQTDTAVLFAGVRADL